MERGAGHFWQECHHKVRMYKEYQSVCPLVGIGTLPTPLSQACVPLPPRTGGGGGAHSPAGEGLEESQFRRLEKTLTTLPTLWMSLSFSALQSPTANWEGLHFTSHYCILPARELSHLYVPVPWLKTASICEQNPSIDNQKWIDQPILDYLRGN
jgi:hypothetical protein